MLSVLIATFDRPRLLERSVHSALAALDAAGIRDFEIVVGVNGPDPSSESALATLSAHPGADALKIVRFGERFTPSACRNRLLNHVRGEWIYFLDDDAYVDREFFKSWQRSPLRADCAAIGGPNLNPPRSSLFQDVTSWTLESRFATYFSAARYRGRGEPRLCSEEALILCNLFVRRSALNELSFLEDLKCAEENWMLQNIARARLKLGYDPGLSVWHERRPDPGSFARQVFKYGYGRGQIFRRRVSGLRWAHVVPAACLLYTVALPFALVFAPSPAWFAPYLVYAALCLAFAFKPSRRPVPWRVRWRSAALFPLVHAAYGLGLMAGIVKG